MKRKEQEKAPQSRQRLTKAPEQTTILSRHPDKVPRTQHLERVNSPVRYITHSSGSWLTRPPYLCQNSDLTQCPPQPQCNSMSSSASLSSAKHQYSPQGEKKSTSLNSGPSFSRALRLKIIPSKAFSVEDAHSSLHPRDIEMEVETIAWVTYQLLSLNGCGSPRALPDPLPLCLSPSLSLFLLCTDCRELKELAGTVFQMT